MIIEKFEGELEEVDCPLCGEGVGRRTIFQREDGIGFYQCDGCNIQYASPRFTEESLLNIYESDEWKDVSEYDDWTFEHWVQNKDHTYYLVEQNVELVKRYLPPGSRVLDVGCDIGLTVRMLNDNGYLSEGVEPSSLGAKIAREKTGITVHEMELGLFEPDEKYDGLMILDVLEHLYDPVKTLKDCADRIKKDGYIFIHVPNHRGISNRYKAKINRWGIKKTFNHFGFPAHIYHFDKTSLSVALEKTGFKVLNFESWSKALTEGRVNWKTKLLIASAKKWAHSDYIVCIAKRL